MEILLRKIQVCHSIVSLKNQAREHFGYAYSNFVRRTFLLTAAFVRGIFLKEMSSHQRRADTVCTWYGLLSSAPGISLGQSLTSCTAPIPRVKLPRSLQPRLVEASFAVQRTSHCLKFCISLAKQEHTVYFDDQ